MIITIVHDVNQRTTNTLGMNIVRTT